MNDESNLRNLLSHPKVIGLFNNPHLKTKIDVQTIKKTMKRINVLLLIVCVFILHTVQSQTINTGDIPINRLSASKWQNFKWDGSGDWKTIDVTKEGIMPGSTEDITPKVMAIIENGSGKRILKFPAGIFYINSTLNISKDDIQIVGEGNSTKFMLAGGANHASIIARGTQTGSYKLTTDVFRGDSIVTLSSAEGLNVGDYFVIEQKGSLTRQGPDVKGKECQIFKINKKSGNQLVLDMKFGIPFLKDHASIAKINFKKNLRFHNFYIEMTSTPTEGHSHNISLSEVQNVELSNVESNKALHTHMELSWSREVIFYQNYLHGNFGHDQEGGYQYGIKLNWCTNCLVINNKTSDLRHHYATQFGTNHCIIAYNRAEPPYNHYGDFGQHNSKGCHNNLWEGNYGCEIYDDANPKKSWGTRYTMWFRNHAISKVGSENAFVEHMTIIGNELETDSSGLKTGPSDKDNFSGANIINVSKEGGKAEVVWGDMKENAIINGDKLYYYRN